MLNIEQLIIQYPVSVQVLIGASTFVVNRYRCGRNTTRKKKTWCSAGSIGASTFYCAFLLHLIIVLDWVFLLGAMWFSSGFNVVLE